MIKPIGDTFGVPIMSESNEQRSVRKAAHDVRTPLTSISGFAELLIEDTSLSPIARENAEIILNETKRLSEILETFFDEMTAPLPETPTDDR